MQPLVTVVIPVFNRAETILPTIQSVRDQTFRDFECLVVDDGSADGDQLETVLIGLDDARFRYVRRDNGGGSAARNTGIDEARGKIIAFLDSDDRWLPGKLAQDIAAGAQERAVFSPMLIERSGRIHGSRPSRAPKRGEAISEYLACSQGFIPTSTLSLPAEMARGVRYDERIAFGQDADFAIRLARAGAQFFMYPAPLSIMSDDETGDRLSRSNDWQAALAWADRSRPLLSNRAYYALRGWHVARLAAGAGKHGTALRLYLDALARGALPAPLAVKALVQILVPRSLYKGSTGR